MEMEIGTNFPTDLLNFSNRSKNTRQFKLYASQGILVVSFYIHLVARTETR